MRMAEIAAQFLGGLTDTQRQAAAYPFHDPRRLRWTYVPTPRPGVSLLGLDRQSRKGAHRLLATALSRHAFAQVVTIMALEEVLDLDEGGARGRHSDDYHLAVFGTPGDDEWGWRFEGHHVSVTATVSGGRVEVAPLFLGAHPAGVWYGSAAVVRPLPLEEELARALLAELSPALRGRAIVADEAPPDILTGTSEVTSALEPLGVRGDSMGSAERDLLAGLTAVYLDRLAPELRGSHDAAGLSFAWAGPATPGAGHYYRIQGQGLLIEYDNTADAADHAHTVIRRPGADFGAAILPAHLTGELGLS
ncbi:DUF3500 domain-containing protein [Nonomuraea recticatena]|uniref:DUF3500 domain-containing protein n=1 Tax=Nonomuraea recticatena TaxID=46178 RepID=A0ABP6ESD0_9ACTN